MMLIVLSLSAHDRIYRRRLLKNPSLYIQVSLSLFLRYYLLIHFLDFYTFCFPAGGMMIKIKEKSLNEYWRRSSRTTWCSASESLFELYKYPTHSKIKSNYKLVYVYVKQWWIIKKYLLIDRKLCTDLITLFMYVYTALVYVNKLLKGFILTDSSRANFIGYNNTNISCVLVS